ncbi:RNA polymerase sigma factor [Spirosoma litoris]
MEIDFIQIVNTHAGILHKICRLYGKEEEDRKDLYQEIVLQLWRSFPTFRQEAQPSTWLYRVALNTAISLVRWQSRRITPVMLDNELLTDLQGPGTAEIDDQMHQFYKAVEYLSSIEKALVFLYLDGNSYDEIARIMGISNSNVGVKLNRIKAKLKRIVTLLNN